MCDCDSITNADPNVNSGTGGIILPPNPTANYILSTTGTTLQWAPWSNIAGVLNFSSPTTTTRTLVSFTDFNGTTSPIRSVALSSTLVFTLAAFSPSFSIPSRTANWDEPVTSFTVYVTNDALVPSQYISSVIDPLTSASGIGTTLSAYATTGPSSTPAGGVNWSQIFTTQNNPGSNIYSSTTNYQGGSAGATVNFNYYNGSGTAPYGTTAAISIEWKNWNTSIFMTNLSGKYFYVPYTETSYTVSSTNLSTTPTYTVTPFAGSVSSTSASGIFTFDSAITNANYGSVATAAGVTVSTLATRPVTVTGGPSYQSILTATANVSSASFNYPSIYYYKLQDSGGNQIRPENSDIMSAGGGALNPGNGTSNSAVTITSTNSSSSWGSVGAPNQILVPFSSGSGTTIWFGVRESSSQPTSWKLVVNGVGSAVATSTITISIGNANQLERYMFYGTSLSPNITYPLFIS